MTHPLADSMYDHDMIQAQSRQPEPQTTTSELGEIQDDYIELIGLKYNSVLERELRKNKTIGESVATATNELREAIEQKYIRREDLAGLIPEKYEHLEIDYEDLKIDWNTYLERKAYNQAIDDFRQTLNLVEENI